MKTFAGRVLIDYPNDPRVNSQRYMDELGKANSKRRLMKLANSIAVVCRNNKRKEELMSADPYLDLIDEQWANIVRMYQTFKDKDQIIEFEVSDEKIYSYPAGDYIQTLSERTRDQTTRQFAEAKKRKQFILFVKDTPNRRLRSYILDVPE